MNDHLDLMNRRRFLAGLASAALVPNALSARPPDTTAKTDDLQPYTGPNKSGVDPQSLHGKVMCGYQGWFNAPGDGAGRGWVHWNQRGGAFEPGNVTVDLWPDMTEYGPDERFNTGFLHKDGRVAHVFSSYCKPTVRRHFQWMEQYGIDGAFVQRFIHDMDNPAARHHHNAVLSHAREGANRHGRVYALMYDLSGLRRGRLGQLFADLQMLREKMLLTKDPAYLHHRGKPLVAFWGVGFGGKDRPSLAECKELVETIRKLGDLSVMIGAPTHWRRLSGDAMDDPRLHDVYKQIDVISPWTVGRYDNLPAAEHHVRQIHAADLAWCRQHGVDFLPVAFPGFSWSNLHGGKLNQIPRLGGRLLWKQATTNREIGAKSLYVAMFDEVDEGTAIFKCTNDPPVSEQSKFITYEGLPSDHYLKVAGRIAAMYHGKLKASLSLEDALASS